MLVLSTYLDELPIICHGPLYGRETSCEEVKLDFTTLIGPSKRGMLYPSVFDARLPSGG